MRVSLQTPEHPWQNGHIFHSPGTHFTYRVIGPCCRLFDREELPWPCCRLQWKGKEPSWRRIGRRFVADMAVRNYPSYAVEILGSGHQGESFVLTLYNKRLDSSLKAWWYTKIRAQTQIDQIDSKNSPVPPHLITK